MYVLTKQWEKESIHLERRWIFRAESDLGDQSDCSSHCVDEKIDPDGSVCPTSSQVGPRSKYTFPHILCIVFSFREKPRYSQRVRFLTDPKEMCSKPCLVVGEQAQFKCVKSVAVPDTSFCSASKISRLLALRSYWWKLVLYLIFSVHTGADVLKSKGMNESREWVIECERTEWLTIWSVSTENQQWQRHQIWSLALSIIVFLSWCPSQQYTIQYY